MLDALTIAVGVAALALAAWCGFAAYRDQPTKDWHFIGMAVVSLLALAQLVVGIVQMARGERPEQGMTIFIAYLIGAFLAVPAAGFLSLSERTRWGSVTVAAGAVVLAVLEVRLYDIWGKLTVTDTDRTPAAAGGEKRPFDLGTGPGRVLVWFYGVFTVAAASRAIVEMILHFEKAPLPYVLSAAAAAVYGFITYSLVRGGERARRTALACCAAELAGVLIVGTWTLIEPSAFSDATVWSSFGRDYLFIPVILPVTGMMWLRRARTA